MKIHKELEELAGAPPFHVVLGKKDNDALSFEELRTKVLEIAATASRCSASRASAR